MICLSLTLGYYIHSIQPSTVLEFLFLLFFVSERIAYMGMFLFYEIHII